MYFSGMVVVDWYIVYREHLDIIFILDHHIRPVRKQDPAAVRVIEVGALGSGFIVSWDLYINKCIPRVQRHSR